MLLRPPATLLSRPPTSTLPTTLPPTRGSPLRPSSGLTTHTDSSMPLPEHNNHRTPSPSTLRTAQPMATTSCHHLRMDQLPTRSTLPVCRAPSTSPIQLLPCPLHRLSPPGPAPTTTISTSIRISIIPMGPLPHREPHTRPKHPMLPPSRFPWVQIILRQILMRHSRLALHAPIQPRRLQVE